MKKYLKTIFRYLVIGWCVAIIIFDIVKLFGLI